MMAMVTMIRKIITHSFLHSGASRPSVFASLMVQENGGMQNDDLLNAFRAQYQHFSMAIPAAIQSNTDPVSLARLGDDLDEYCHLAQGVRLSSHLCRGIQVLNA